MTPIKWFAATIGVVIGVSHIGLIGMVANRKGDKLPDLEAGELDDEDCESCKI